MMMWKIENREHSIQEGDGKGKRCLIKVEIIKNSKANTATAT